MFSSASTNSVATLKRHANSVGGHYIVKAHQTGLFSFSVSYLSVTFLFRKLLGHFNMLSVSFLPAFLASYVAILLERPSRRSLLALYVTNVVSYHETIVHWYRYWKCHMTDFSLYPCAGYGDSIPYGCMERSCSSSSLWSGFNFCSCHDSLIVLLQRTSSQTGLDVQSPQVRLIVFGLKSEF